MWRPAHSTSYMPGRNGRVAVLLPSFVYRIEWCFLSLSISLSACACSCPCLYLFPSPAPFPWRHRTRHPRPERRTASVARRPLPVARHPSPVTRRSSTSVPSRASDRSCHKGNEIAAPSIQYAGPSSTRQAWPMSFGSSRRPSQELRRSVSRPVSREHRCRPLWEEGGSAISFEARDTPRVVLPVPVGHEAIRSYLCDKIHRI